MEVVKILFCVVFFEVRLLLTAEYKGYQKSECKHNTSFMRFCCSNQEFKNGTCKECLPGFHSEENSTCKPCTNEKYGRKCRYTCKCNSTERCHHVKGCVIIIERNSINNSRSENTNTTPNDGTSDVVTYMTCVAVGSVLVVVCGLFVKNKEAICRHKSRNNSVTHMINKLKQPTFRDGRNKKVSENVYDDINEKYMLDFDGE